MAVESAKESKARKEKHSEEQLQLLEVSHPQAKPIMASARRYKKLVRERTEALKEEIKEKEKLRALVKEANLKADEDGVVEFRCGKIVVSVTPRDELVKVKDDEASDE